MDHSSCSTLDAMPNYEAMCKDLEKKNCQLQAEKDKLHHACDCLERENEKLRAQMEIVYLIFGGTNR